MACYLLCRVSCLVVNGITYPKGGDISPDNATLVGILQEKQCVKIIGLISSL